MELPESFDTSTFGGFNKKTVLKYIDELCEKAKLTEDGLKEQIAQKEAEAKGLLERIETLEAAAAKHQDHKSTLEETIAELDRELRRQRSAAETYERELGEQKERARQLALRSEGLEMKSRKYDEAMAQIGGALMDARQSAAGVVKTAEEKAARITQAAVDSVHSLAQQVGGFKGDISALRKALQMTMAELANRLDELDNGITQLSGAVEAQLSEYSGAQPAEEPEEAALQQEKAPEEAPDEPVEEPAAPQPAPWEAVEEDEPETTEEPEVTPEPPEEAQPAAAAPKFFW